MSFRLQTNNELGLNRFDLGGFVLSFGLAKIAIYCVPLIVAAIASREVYGGLEVAYAIALLLATALISAPLHGLSHRYLIHRKQDVRDQGAVLVLAGNLFGLCAVGGGMLAGVDDQILLILAISGVASTQIVQSFLLRIRGRSWLRAWVDGLALFVGVVIVAVAEFALGGATLRLTILGFATASLAMATGAAFFLVRHHARHIGQRLRQNMRLGVTMAIYALFGTWIAVSGRILMGITSPADLAAFGVAFRIAGLALGVQQLAGTALWIQMYTGRTREADQLLARFVAATAIVAALISIFGRYVIIYVRFEALDADAALLAQSLLPPVALQIFFWAAHGLLQARVNRLGVAGRALRPLALVSVGGLLIILAAHAMGAATIVIVWMLAFYSAAYFVTSWAMLARRGLPHIQTARAALIGGLGLALLSLSLA